MGKIYPLSRSLRSVCILQQSLPRSLPGLYPVSKLPTSTAQFQPRGARFNLPNCLRPRGPRRARDVAPGAAPLDDTLQRHRIKNVSFPRRWMSNTLHHLHPSKDHTRMIQHKSISASPLPLSCNIETTRQCEGAWISNLSKSTQIPSVARTSPRIPHQYCM